jgi:tetratricopeptide (TPR) repeat protein
MRTFLAILFCGLAASLSAAEPNVAGVNPLEEVTRELQAGHTEAALAALDRVDKAAPPTATGLDLRGCIYLEQGKLEEAIAVFRSAHEMDAALSGPLLHLGDALLRQKKWEEARAVYEGANKGTNILILSERLRYGILLCYLGAKDDAAAQTAFDRLVFPTETAAYYYAQAAWGFAHGNSKAGAKWLRTADKIFDAKQTAWFARPFFEMGWIKTKPPVVSD